MIKLSILLPTYNRKEKFANLIFYLSKEKVFEIDSVEVIISDNHSTDGTSEYIKTLKRKNLDSYVQKKNIGIIGNFRFLLSKAQGEYLWIMGDDDIYQEGAVKKVIKLIDSHPECAHIFLNYASISNGKVKPCLELENYQVKSSNGIEFLRNITAQVDIGALMYISANIFHRQIINNSNKIIDKMKISDNMALPLGYSLCALHYMNYCTKEVLVINDGIETTSWSDREILVYCRDIIEMIDVMTKAMNSTKDIRRICFSNIPVKYPEFRYMLKGHRFKKNNYAFDYYLKNCPYKLVCDLFGFIIYCLKYPITKFRRNRK